MGICLYVEMELFKDIFFSWVIKSLLVGFMNMVNFNGMIK